MKIYASTKCNRHKPVIIAYYCINVTYCPSALSSLIFFLIGNEKDLNPAKIDKEFQEIFNFILLFAFWWEPKESKLMSTDLWQAYFSYPQLPNPAKLSLHSANPTTPELNLMQIIPKKKKKGLVFLGLSM